MYVILFALIAFIAGYLLRGKWNNRDTSNGKQIVGIESGGNFPTEYYYIAKYDLDTLRRLEKVHGCLDCDKEVFNNRVKPILDSAEKAKPVETILGYK